MTVKCLSDYNKATIRSDFVHNGSTLESLALEHGRSRRTIIRTLEEAGIDPGVKKRKPRLSKVNYESVTGRMPFDYLSPNEVVHTTHTPWYRKVIDWFKPSQITSMY